MKRLTDDRGSVLAFTAIIFVVLLLITGLVIDFGRAYVVLAQLQAAIDAAALAGASEIVLKYEESAETGELIMWHEVDPYQAESEALRVFTANANTQEFDRQGISIVSLVIATETGNQVRVTVIADINTFLVGPITQLVDSSTDFRQLRLSRTAVAEAKDL